MQKQFELKLILATITAYFYDKWQAFNEYVWQSSFIQQVVIPLALNTHASISMSNVKKFGIFALLLFVGMWIGGLISSYVLPIFGIYDPTVSSILAFIITVISAFILLRKFGKKSVSG